MPKKYQKKPMICYQNAKNFKQLIKMNVKIVQGEAFSMSYGVELDMNPIMRKLFVQINNAGFLTLDSQPGIFNCNTSNMYCEIQRPYISGLMEKGTEKKFINRMNKAGFWAVTWYGPHLTNPFTENIQRAGMYVTYGMIVKNGKGRWSNERTNIKPAREGDYFEEMDIPSKIGASLILVNVVDPKFASGNEFFKQVVLALNNKPLTIKRTDKDWEKERPPPLKELIKK